MQWCRLLARCFHFDKNHLAVEMAKLSLWLITMDKGRPFSFLDHALKCGDSLVGVTLEQLRHWNLDTATTSGALYADTIRTDIDRIIALRREIEQLPVRTPDDLVHKRILLLKAEATLDPGSRRALLQAALAINPSAPRIAEALRAL